ncbi:LysR family transcriptional regulator [Saccharopolyspora sp. NPDC050642]|uniref:LysR family transcriptional regulator n=1 Tax=Saccharopolyspora sp. NPDC050642 TaxID=3157099 RepID=UPI00340A813F
MEFRQLECFLAVVEHGGIVRAAAALHLAQPSLTQSIQALEQELGIELFHRVGRGVALTPAGSALVKPARQVLRDAGTVRASAAELAGADAGQLQISAIPGCIHHPLVELVSAFAELHPEIPQRITEADSEQQLAEWVREGRVELGFGYLPAPESSPSRPEPELEITVLGQDELCLAVPVELSAQLDDPVPLSELPELPVIAVSRGAVARQTVEDALRNAGVRTSLGVVTEHRDLELPLVSAGLGMAWTTRASAQGSPSVDVAVHSLDPPVVLSHGVLRRRGHLAPPAQAFLDLALSSAERHG